MSIEENVCPYCFEAKQENSANVCVKCGETIFDGSWVKNFNYSPITGVIPRFNTLKIGDYLNNEKVVDIIKKDDFDALALEYGPDKLQVHVVVENTIVASEAYFETVEQIKDVLRG